MSGRRGCTHWPAAATSTAYRNAVMGVLTFKHFPPQMLASFLPVLKRGPQICLQRARALGVI
jgi:hypothetical protein